MRVICLGTMTIFPVLAALAAENGRGESGIKNLLRAHKMLSDQVSARPS